MVGCPCRPVLNLQASLRNYDAQLDQRLARLPEAIAEGISPKSIAARINESLRQQFVQSTIPESANALSVAAAQIKKAAAEFGRAASTLGNSYHGAAEEARKAIGNLESASSHAISSTKRALKICCASFIRNIDGRSMHC